MTVSQKSSRPSDAIVDIRLGPAPDIAALVVGFYAIPLAFLIALGQSGPPFVVPLAWFLYRDLRRLVLIRGRSAVHGIRLMRDKSWELDLGNSRCRGVVTASMSLGATGLILGLKTVSGRRAAILVTAGLAGPKTLRALRIAVRDDPDVRTS